MRQDNADQRLSQKGYDLGLVSEERYKKMLEKRAMIDGEIERLKKIMLTPKEETNKALENLGTTQLNNGLTLYDLIKRPEITYDMTEIFDSERENLPKYIKMSVQTEIKYEGYIKKQMADIEKFKKLEEKKLSHDIDYSKIPGLKKESAEKLNEIKPDSIGQASRISGVSPADVNVLLIRLKTGELYG